MHDTLKVFYREKMVHQANPQASEGIAHQDSFDDNLAVVVPLQLAVAVMNNPLFDFLTAKNSIVPDVKNT